MEQTNKRIYYFDMAKGIGIILVVLGHLEYISMQLRYFIVSFHMPMFFIISGMLMQFIQEEKKDMKIILNRKVHRMMLPYVYFSILYFFIEIIYLKLTGIGSWESIWLNVYQSLCLYGVSVLWFLPAIFFGEIMFLFLRKHLSNQLTALLVLALTIIMCFANWGLEMLNMLYGNLLWFSLLHYFLAMIIRCFFSMSFICIGYYLFYIIKRKEQFSIIELILGILFLIITIIISQINGAVDLHFLVFSNVFFYYAASILGSLAIILLCKCLEPISNFIPCKILRYYGVNSLIVMATHINSYVLYGAILVSLKLISYITRARNYIFCSSIMIIVFISEIFIIELINRYLPFMVGNVKSVSKEVK